MGEPVIERKGRKPTTINLLEARLRAGEQEARKLLHMLEEAMVRCGYVRDAVYNSRIAGWSDSRKRATVLHWQSGKLSLGRGFQKPHPKGKGEQKRVPLEPVPVDRMNAYQLIAVANNLAPFIDSLEGNVRWQIDALQKASATIRVLIDGMTANPRPSETPAQHDPDPDPPASAQNDPQ